MNKKLIKTFAILLIIDVLTNLVYAWFIGVKIDNSQIIVTSILFSLVMTLLLNQMGVLKNQ